MTAWRASRKPRRSDSSTIVILWRTRVRSLVTTTEALIAGDKLGIPSAQSPTIPFISFPLSEPILARVFPLSTLAEPIPSECVFIQLANRSVAAPGNDLKARWMDAP